MMEKGYPFRPLRRCKLRISMLLFAAIILQGLVSIINHPNAVNDQEAAKALVAIDQPMRSSTSATIDASKPSKPIHIINSSATTSNNSSTREIPELAAQKSRAAADTKPKKKKPLKLRVKCGKRPKVLNHIRVANTTSSYPKILCFVMTPHSESHNAKLKAIRHTWGKRCDKLLMASNHTDLELGVVHMKSESTYLGLWEKLNETLQYIWDHHRNEGYDWILKADDDTYVILENLKEYLAAPDIATKMEQPMIHGRRYSAPQYKNLAKRPVYFGNPVNAAFGKRFYEKINKDKSVIYNYGGAGYAMNWPYVKKFLEVMKGPDTVHGTPPEDQAHGVVMAYHDIWPENTRDDLGRERFHQEGPEFMYSMNDKFRRLWNDNHQETGGLSVGPECCSEQSISFHHVRPSVMVNLDQYLYACEGRE